MHGRKREKIGEKSAEDETANVNRSAGSVGLATFLSRILGFVRDMIIAALFGAMSSADAFFVAFRIPNLLRRLTAEGAMTAAFVPVFTDSYHTEGKKPAFLFACNVITILTIILVFLVAIGEVFTEKLVALIAPGFTATAESFALTVTLTQIMLPYLLVISVAAVMMGMLNSMKIFFLPALAPVLLNIAIITSALLLRNSFSEPTVALAIGVMAGGILQLAMQYFPLVKRGFRFRLSFDLKDRATRKVGLLILPGIFGMAVAEINIFVDTLLASLLPEGSVSSLYYGNRITQFPLGIFGVAISIASLPALSRVMTGGGFEKMTRLFTHAIRLTFFISIPAMCGLVILAEPISNLLFERGEFGESARISCAVAVVYYAIGLSAFSGVKVAVSAFYALKDTVTPVRIAAFSMLVNIILNLLLMKPLGAGGLALATSIASWLNLFLLLFFLHKKGSYGALMQIVIPGMKMAGGAIIMSVPVWFYNNRFYSYADPALWRAFHLFSAIGIGLAVYFVLMLILKSPTAEEIKTTITTRFR